MQFSSPVPRLVKWWHRPLQAEAHSFSGPQVYLVEEDDGEVVLDIVRVGPTVARVAFGDFLGHVEMRSWMAAEPRTNHVK